MRMKVLHLVKTSDGAGWALREMRELVKLGIEVHVALPLNGSKVQQYRDCGIVVHGMVYSFSNPFTTIKLLRRIVDEVKPDIIHSHFVQTTLFARIGLRKYHIPRIFQVAGPLHLEHALTKRLDLWTVNKDDLWIPTCKWVYNEYKASGIADNRLLLSRYGGERTPREYAKGLLRKELELDDSAIIVGMVAYMYPPKRYVLQKRGIKGHEDFIDAIAILSQKYNNLYGVCIGGAWNGATSYEVKIRDYASKKTDRVYLLGTRTNVPDLYQDFNVAVHPSHSENLGGAAESLYLSIPTVATNVGGFPDIVIDGETGYLAEPKKPASLAAAIEKVLANPEKAKMMAIKGHDLICQQSVYSTTKQVADFYTDILSRQNV